MLNIYFPHYEAFGGPLINNIIGSIVNGFTALTNAFLTDVTSVVLAYIFLNLFAMIYVLVRSLDPSSAMKFIIDPEKPYINIITKGILLIGIFTLFLKPIPVIQMTPVIAYSESNESANINRGDRLVAGWLVNDMKTTTNLHGLGVFDPVPTWSSDLYKRDDSLQDTAEMMFIPQIFWFLGMFEAWYYGFPDLNLSNMISPSYTGRDADGDLEASFFKYAPIASMPTLLNCVANDDMKNKLLAMESGIVARIELDNLSGTCAPKMSVDPNNPGEWHLLARNSGSSIIFGANTVGEGLSDFFEPIDRFFYYLSSTFISELISDRIQVDVPSAVVKQATKFAIIDNDPSHIINDMSKKASAKDKVLNESIKDNAKKIVENLQLITDNLAPGQEIKAFANMAHDIIINQRKLDFWRKNQPFNPDKATINKTLYTKNLSTSTVLPIALEQQFIAQKNTPERTTSEYKISSTPAKDIADLLEKLSIQFLEITNKQGTMNADNLNLVEFSLANATVPFSSFQEFNLRDDALTKEQSKKLADFQIKAFQINKYIFTKSLLLEYTKELKQYTQNLLTHFEQFCSEFDNDPSTTSSCNDTKFASSPNSQITISSFTPQTSVAGMYKSTYYKNVSGDILIKLVENNDIANKDHKDIYLSHESLIDELNVDYSHAGSIALAPPIFSEVVPKNFWTSGTNEDTLPRIIKYSSGINTPFANATAQLLSAYIKDSEVQQVIVNEDKYSFNFDYFDNWTGNKTKDAQIKTYFETELQKAYSKVGLESFDASTGTLQFPSPFKDAPTDPKINESFEKYTAHHTATVYPDYTEGAIPAIINLNTLKMVISQFVVGSNDHKLKYITKFNDLILALKSSSIVDCKPGPCKVKLNPILQKELVLSGISATLDSDIVTTLSAYISNKASEYKIEPLILEKWAKNPIPAPHIATLDNKGKIQMTKAECILKPTNERPMHLRKSCNAAPDTLPKVQTVITAAPASALTPEAVIPVSSNMKINISYDNWFIKSVSTLFSWAWDMFSIPLDVLRSLQNTALIQTATSLSSEGSFYQPQFLIGSYSTIDSAQKIISSSDTTASTHTNIQLPKPSPAFDSANVIEEIKKYFSKEIPGINMSLSDLIQASAILAAITIFFGGSGILVFLIASVYYLFRFVVYLALPTVMIILLGIMAGIFGFFRATIIAPLAVAVRFIASDFSRGFKDPQTHPELSSLLNSKAIKSLLDYKQQFAIAFKQLSAWIVSVTLIFALLWIDNTLLNGWQQTAMMRAWVADITGQDLAIYTSYFIIVLAATLYGYLVHLSYSKLEDFMKSNSINDPLFNSVTELLKQSKQLANNMTNK